MQVVDNFQMFSWLGRLGDPSRSLLNTILSSASETPDLFADPVKILMSSNILCIFDMF